jgi:hypothetical protein
MLESNIKYIVGEFRFIANTPLRSSLACSSLPAARHFHQVRELARRNIDYQLAQLDRIAGSFEPFCCHFEGMTHRGETAQVPNLSGKFKLTRPESSIQTRSSASRLRRSEPSGTGMPIRRSSASRMLSPVGHSGQPPRLILGRPFPGK